MPEFFSKFPKIKYDLSDDGGFVNLTNISRNTDVDDSAVSEASGYALYEIGDGVRPDVVSYKLYGTTEYYWTFFVVNNHLRAGLNEAWPISSKALDKHFDEHYDPYSVISFDPTRGGRGSTGLVQLLDLEQRYLPYLRLASPSGMITAKIKKYDSSRLQLIIYDIKEYVSPGVYVSKTADVLFDRNETFAASLRKKNKKFYKFIWIDNPYDEIDEAEDFANYEDLKREFVLRQNEIYKEFDPNAEPDTEMYDEIESQADLDLAIYKYKYDYIFDKVYYPANTIYSWISWRNAASTYFTVDEISGEKRIESAYDIITNENITAPTYYSFFEEEEIVNDSKSKIRVISKSRIVDFARDYFSSING